MFDEQSKRLETLEAEHAKVEKSTRRKLATAGSGVESMPAFPRNVNAAERQFDMKVRQNTEVKTAADGVQRCRNHIENLRRQKSDSKRDCVSARDELEQTARRIIGMPKIQQQQRGPMFKAG